MNTPDPHAAEVEELLDKLDFYLCDFAPELDNKRRCKWCGEPVSSYHHTMKAAILSLMEQRERQAVANELRFIDAANKDNGINSYTGAPTNNGWETMREYTKRRLAGLTAYQHEPKKEEK